MSKTAREIVNTEADGQIAMWGAGAERADNSHGEIMMAALCSLGLSILKDNGISSEDAVEYASSKYPPGWSGFRDYGSIIANLAVVGAYIESEIDRRLAAGEDTTRTKRGEPYVLPADQMPKQPFPETPEEAPDAQSEGTD